MRKLVLFALILGVAYGVTAYWGPATHYVQIRHLAQKLANQVALEGDSPEAIRTMLTTVRKETGVWIPYGNVDVRHLQERTEVKLDVTIPVTFPFLDQRREHTVSITAHTNRGYMKGPKL